MGDRANVKIVDGGSTVYLYTHWNGTELPAIVQAALAKKQRWDDGPYLTRIVFQQMLGDDHGETGYGISASLGDGDDRIITLNIDAGHVVLNDVEAPFSEFIAITDPHWK